MDIRKREILRAFSVSEEAVIKLLNKILLLPTDEDLVIFIKAINKETYNSHNIEKTLSERRIK